MKDIYIVSHEEQPFSKKNITAFIHFCKNKKDDDIICLVQSYDDIIDVNAKYYLYKNSIVFAEQLLSKDWLTRYVQKKIYRKTKLPNPHVFIGSCKNIIEFCEGMPTNNEIDLQKYVLNKYIKQEKSTIYDDDFIVDAEHEIFRRTRANKIQWNDVKKYIDVFTFEMNFVALSFYIMIVLVLVAKTDPLVSVF
jgi:hypothetical protein